MVATSSPTTFNPSDACTEPPARVINITASDATEFAFLTRAIMVGVSGDVAVEALNASGVYASAILPNLAAGVWHPCVCRKILSTGTATATKAGTIAIGW